jgi:plastocyanin
MKRMAIALSAVALLGVACGGDGGGGGGGTTSSLSMVDNEFEPSDFTAGGTSLTVTNDGAALHNLTVADGGIDQDVAAGESAEVDLSGLDPGTFDMTCRYHPEMTGSITIG